MPPSKYQGIPGNGLTICFNIVTSIIYTIIAGINIVKNIINNGIANGRPNPNGITNKTTITDANANSKDTIISTIAPIDALSVSYIPNNVNILAVMTPCVLCIVSFIFIRMT